MTGSSRDCRPTVLHVPIPLSTQGDSVMTVVQELCRQHRLSGWQPAVILSDNRHVSIEDARNVFVDYTRYCPKEWFSRREKWADVMAGFLGLARRNYGRLYLPATEAAAAIAPDAVVVHESHYAAPSLPRWRQACPGSKIVLYVHVNLSRSYQAREMRRLLTHADAVVFVSHSQRDSNLHRIPGRRDRCFVIHNGVDTERFRPPANHSIRPSVPQSPFEVLFVGRVIPQKGPDRLLRAMARVRSLTDVPMRTTIVGGGGSSGELTEYEGRLRVMARESGLCVDFLPFVAHSETPDLYRRASVLAVPSMYEDPFPLVVFEAMASGTPVVCSTRGGLREAGGDVAIFADPDDADGFARAIVQLAESPSECERRSLAGRAWAEAHSWRTASQKLLDIITDA